MQIRNTALAAALALSLVAVAVAAHAQAPKPGKTYAIGYSQILDHPALNATRQGFLDGLKAAGYVEGQNLKFEYQNAQGNPGNARAIEQQFMADKVDLLAPCTTPIAQATAKLAKGGPIPVAYGCITDPVVAGLASSYDKPDGSNITGFYSLDPAAQTIDLIVEMLPNVKTVGTLFNGGEANSVAINAVAKAEATKKGLKWVEVQVTGSADVKTAVDSLAGRVDAVFTPGDNTVASAYDAVLKSTRDNKLPLFSTDTTTVDRGAVAAMGFDQYAKGVAWAKFVAAPILGGADPAKMVPYNFTDAEMLLSATNAQALGITIPAAVKARAKSVK